VGNPAETIKSFHLTFEFLQPLFDRFQIEAPIRTQPKSWYAVIFQEAINR
jgi:hypothetical protein